MPDTIWLKTFPFNQNKIIVFAGYESDAGKYYAATAEREKTNKESEQKRKYTAWLHFQTSGMPK